MIPADAVTLTSVIATRAMAQPDAVIMTFLAAEQSAQALTYGQLHVAAQALAGQLVQAGIRPGDLVVVAGDHNARLIAGFLATLYAGATPTLAPYPVAFNQPARYEQRLLEVATISQARAVLALTGIQSTLRASLGGAGCMALEPATLTAAAPTAAQYDLPIYPSVPSAPAYVQFSSGTTGAPKGAVVTQAAALCHLRMLIDGLALTTRDVLVGWAPFYHDLGLVLYLLLPIVSGIPAVTMAPDYWVRRPQILLHALHQYGGTICVMPNFGFAHTTRNVRQRDVEGLNLGGVRQFIAGAEVVQPETLHAFATRYQAVGVAKENLRVGYGMTECVFMASLTSPDRLPTVDRVARLALLNDHCAVPSAAADAVTVISCGAPLPATTIAILDEQGAPLPERQVGEIAIASPALFAGYLQRPDLTEASLRQGWLRTGDLGYQANGELFVIDRKKDLIIAAGKHIYPETLERLALAALGATAGRAAAFGVRSVELGTEIPVLVCEVRGHVTEAEAAHLVAEIRRQVQHGAEIDLADVRLVRRGWLEITTSGKISRVATREKYLAAGYRQEPPIPQLQTITAADPQRLAQVLTTLASEILGVAKLQMEDNFFNIGGDSLTVVRFILTVEEQLNADVGPDFFQNPTVAHLVRLLGAQTSSPAALPQQRNSPATARAIDHSIRPRGRLIRAGPILRGLALPYGLGIRFQRAWLGLPGVEQALFDQEVALLHRWGERVGAPPAAAIVRQSLLANTWRSWRIRVLTAPLGDSPWVTIQGDPTLWQPRQGRPGVTFLVLHSHLSYVFIRSCAASGVQTRIIDGAANDAGVAEQDRSAQVYRAYQALRRGEIVVVGGDGSKGAQGVTVPFFGGQRLFRQGGAELAVQTGAPLVPVFCTISTAGQVNIDVCAPLTAEGSTAAARVEGLTRAYANLVVARWPQVYPSLAWGNLASWLRILQEQTDAPR